MFAKKKVKQLNDDAAHALNAALRLLTAREYSKKELYKKLCAGHTRAAAEAAVNRCVAERWQSDERYAQILCRHTVLSFHGEQKLRYDAKQKGISSELIAKFIEETDWTAVAFEFLKKRTHLQKQLSFKDRQKLMASLYRRGFLTDQCRDAVEQLAEITGEAIDEEYDL